MNRHSKYVMLIKIDGKRDHEWNEAFAQTIPDLEIRIWPFINDPSEIDFALLWHPPEDLFRSIQNLKVIFSVGAGVDHLTQCTTLPSKIPIIRMIDPSLKKGVAEYVLYHVLRIQRRMNDYMKHQLEKQWQRLDHQEASQISVGIMGVGEIGLAVALQLVALGYKVCGWSQTSKVFDSIDTYVGLNDLPSFLASANILVIVLPLTSSTRDIINADKLLMLPRGSHLINVGRGGLIVEDELLAFIKSGHIASAALDVFKSEPLRESHEFWINDNIFITPHIAGVTNPLTAVKFILSNIARFKLGVKMIGEVNIEDYR
ncbi:MAG: glyoxylate/hydroxypyruvate reductase A [Acidiferrobacteraceae bacterium]|nr:glyoxylate/hydroxypyruvate reductase A [Acidiferrobacteraceae bacterium]|tara:strand:- start:2790 stop:3737 length:948 start_codon:yes stop_codon:yes gene_type:complete